MLKFFRAMGFIIFSFALVRFYGLNPAKAETLKPNVYIEDIHFLFALRDTYDVDVSSCDVQSQKHDGEQLKITHHLTEQCDFSGFVVLLTQQACAAGPAPSETHHFANGVLESTATLSPDVCRAIKKPKARLINHTTSQSVTQPTLPKPSSTKLSSTKSSSTEENTQAVPPKASPPIQNKKWQLQFFVGKHAPDKHDVLQCDTTPLPVVHEKYQQQHYLLTQPLTLEDANRALVQFEQKCQVKAWIRPRLAKHPSHAHDKG
ncbi:hypothetical protein VCRA2110O318_150024 [Vibrio crassostreae]|nr:hypothetical protein VCRA2117O328_150078 [Vibrio crassostreae]CAK2276096.1 hypothetical protein VCRA2110O318_150024 [Vibrio crassostreae]CAK2412898.1 hypothetical protein VCRA2110O319_140078 [Vibrio crassostreae]CAK2645706.1 hypothetical protein VCRA217O317_150025 [Vibrio crassostreae]